MERIGSREGEEALQNYDRLFVHPERQRWAIGLLHGGEVLYPHQNRPLQQSDLAMHLRGDRTVGILLVQPGSDRVKAGCIDIDCPRDAENLASALDVAQNLQQSAIALGLQTEVEFSGRRGFHLWLFSATPVSAVTMQEALGAIATAARFEAWEIFPVADTAEREYKCIKLPYGVHPATHHRSGFVDIGVAWFGELPTLLEPEKALGAIAANPADAIAEVARQREQKVLGYASGRKSDRKHTLMQEKAGTAPEQQVKFPEYSHPGCIQRLMSSGVPLELNYNQANLTLARYAIERGLDASEAVAIAATMARATPDNHPTGKNELAKVRNFKSSYRTAASKGYRWHCSYALSKISVRDPAALQRRGCTGIACPAWPYGPMTFQPTAFQSERSQRLIAKATWIAAVSLLKEGLAIVRSSLLPRLEQALCDLGAEIVPTTNKDRVRETEVLAQVVREPDRLLEALAAGLTEEGFASASPETPEVFLDRLWEYPIGDRAAFLDCVAVLQKRSLRIRAQRLLEDTQQAIADADREPDQVLDGLVTATRRLLCRQTLQAATMTYHLPDLVTELFGDRARAIATPSMWLNACLNGGFQAGKLYVLAAPPSSGKTSFVTWIADRAAEEGSVAIAAAYEMSRSSLWCSSLARLAGVDSRKIQGRWWEGDRLPADRAEALQESVVEAIDRYRTAIAPRLTLLEATAEHTPAKLGRIVASTRDWAKVPDEEPVLLVVDYLQLLDTGDVKVDRGTNEVLRVSRLATMLKQVARDTGAAVLAVSDISKEAYLRSRASGSLDLGALRDSFRIAHAADVIFLLQTHRIRREDRWLDQLDLAVERATGSSAATGPCQRAESLRRLRATHPLDDSTNDTWARLSIVKNRGGMAGTEPLFRYRRALHRFDPVEL